MAGFVVFSGEPFVADSDGMAIVTIINRSPFNVELWVVANDATRVSGVRAPQTHQFGRAPTQDRPL